MTMRYRLRLAFTIVLAGAAATTVALVSSAYAVDGRKGHDATRYGTGAKHHPKKKKKHGAPRGPVGSPGATGAQGPPGPAGSTGPAGTAGSARAYGLMIGRAIPVADAGSSGSSPYLHNATIQPGKSGSPPGVYCVAVSAIVATPNMTMVVGSAESPSTAAPAPGEVVLPFATWLSGAPDCANGQLEIRTYTYTTNAGSLEMNPSDLVSFSFVVP